MAQNSDQQKQFQERVVHIARVAKVVKGGRRFSFSALVCVGDHNSQVGFGVGKANEVPDAIRKAADVSNKHLIKVPLVDAMTIPFPVIGKAGSTRVLMYPAPPGKGIIAGSAARMIFDLCGIKDIVCKIHGSRNHHNVVRATFQGLSQLQSIDDYAKLRGRSPEHVLQKTTTNRPIPAEAAASEITAEPQADEVISAPDPAENKAETDAENKVEDKAETENNIEDNTEDNHNPPVSHSSAPQTPEASIPASPPSQVPPTAVSSLQPPKNAIETNTAVEADETTTQQLDPPTTQPPAPEAHSQSSEPEGTA